MRTTQALQTNQLKAATLAPTEEKSPPITNARLLRWSGLAAMGAGIIYLAIQPLHPADALASVTTARWTGVHLLSLLMDALGMLGLVGIYASQAKRVGRIGLAGYLLLSAFYAMTFAFHFVESFISPILAKVAPQYVEGMLAMLNGETSAINLGAIPAVYALTGVAYILGGLLLGIATFRANVLPRWSGGLLAIGAAITLFGAAIPHPLNRVMAIPVGIAIIWMGYSVFRKQLRA